MVLGLTAGLLTGPDAVGAGHPGVHNGGHKGGVSRQPPRMSAAHRENRSPARATNQKPRPVTNANVNANASRNARANANVSQSRANASRAGVGSVHGVESLGVGTNSLATAGRLQNQSYQYGTGRSSRRYQARGYGSGYRNRYSGGRSGYGRSQGNTRAVVARLRSVHQNLARLDHDYKGHRVRAMKQIALSVRQLSHRSGSAGLNGLNGSNVGLNANNALASGATTRRANGNGLNKNPAANRAATQHLSQAQSDRRVGQALRTAQGVAMQLNHQGTGSGGHVRARHHLQLAMNEMHTALNVR